MANQAPIPIAIIGIGCRLPGNVSDTEQLWEVLAEGRNTWSSVPSSRFNEEAFHHPNPDNHGTTNHRGGHFLSQDVSAFDAAFFGISPLEAQAMDPQQRLLLETTFEAFENAGIPPESIRGSNTAVYAAMFTRDYDRNIYRDPSDMPRYHIVGSGEAILSNRISYIYDLKGPSMTLDTGCSGSMVSLHLACQSLRTNESDLAFASGVNLILNPDHMFGMSNMHMLNDTGRSYSFDARGSGYGRGEGAVTVLLKRLDDALRDGDNVRAIVRNSAVNQDGKTQGITLPSQQAQEVLARSMYQRAGLDPHEIYYVEAHGTGTVAGDLVELQGISAVFGGIGRQKRSLYVGSIKSNLGHLEASSGLAGLVKAVLVLEKGSIPPNADFQTRKESLKLEEWNLKIPQKLEPWPNDGIRRASVNSFGYGGTNAHVILEEADPKKYSSNHGCCRSFGNRKSAEVTSTLGSRVAQSTERKSMINGSITSPDMKVERAGQEASDFDEAFDAKGFSKAATWKSERKPSTSMQVSRPQLFVLSAKSETSFLAQAANMSKWALRHGIQDYPKDLAYHLSMKRSAMPWRFGLVAGSDKEFISSLQHARPTHMSLTHIRVGFIFTGQGAQWPAMGRELLFTQSRFSKSLQRSDKILRDMGCTWSVIGELLCDEAESRINQSDVAQPATTALQIALVDLLRSFGIEPHMVLGHSSGEVAAAYAAGALTHFTALKVSYCRSFVSSLCKSLISTEGAMLSVGLGEAEVSSLLAQTRKGIVSVACVNSGSSTTLSGDAPAIRELKSILEQRGVFNRMLKVDTAYHSHHMRKIAHKYREALGVLDVTKFQTGTQFWSTVTAREKSEGFDASYWVQNLVSKVRFNDALQEMCKAEVTDSSSTHVFLEIGPHSVLSGPIREILKQVPKQISYTYVPSLVRGCDAMHSTLKLAGKMFEVGYPIDLVAVNSITDPNYRPTFVHDLPTYPWDYSTTYWHESRLSREYRLRMHPYHDLLGVRFPSSTPIEPVWRHILSIESLPWLAEHVIDDLVVFPGAGYICMAIEAMKQHLGPDQHAKNTILRDVSFLKALVVPSAPLKVEMQLSLRTRQLGRQLWHAFCVTAVTEGVWHEHCRGLVRAQLLGKDDEVPLKLEDMPVDKGSMDEIMLEPDLTLDSETLYSQLRRDGNYYGPRFAAIQDLKMTGTKALGQVLIPNIQSIMPSKHMEPHTIHPTTLDAIMHTALPLYAHHHGPGSIMPISLGELTISSEISRDAGKELLVSTDLASGTGQSAQVGCRVFEGNTQRGQRPAVTISSLEILGFGDSQNGTVLHQPAKSNSYVMKWGVDIDHLSKSRTSIPLFTHLKDLYFKFSSLSVLQIGWDPVNALSAFLQAFGDDCLLAPINQYDIKSLSTESLQRIQTAVKDSSQLLHFKTSYLDQGPDHLDVAAVSYHLVIDGKLWGSDEHSRRQELSATHSILKPGGRLLIVGSNDQTHMKSLHETLLKCSFSGIDQLIDIDQYINDIGNEASARPLILSTTALFEPQASVCTVQVLVTDGVESIARTLCKALEERNCTVQQRQWEDDLARDEQVYLVVDNGQTPILANQASTHLGRIARITGRKSSIFWVSAQKDASASRNAEKGLVTGLARSVCAENHDLRFITLDVQDDVVHDFRISESIADLFLVSMDVAKRPATSRESEYVYRDGQVLIPRIISDSGVTAWMNGERTQTTTELVIYGDRSRPLKLCEAPPDSTDRFIFVDDKSAEALQHQSKVQVVVQAHLLDSEASVFHSSSSNITQNVVYEFAGTVVAVGLEAQRMFQVGDRVYGWTHEKSSQYASHVSIDPHCLHRIPDSVPLAVGTASFSSLITAYHCLIDIADLQKGQKLLLRGAVGGLGQAFVALSRHLGATTYITASSTVEQNHLESSLELSNEFIFLEGNSGLTATILQATNGGVDVVVNTIISEADTELWDCVTPFGTCLQVGQSSTKAVHNISATPYGKNATFMSIDPAVLLIRRPGKASRILETIVPLMGDGRLVLKHTEMAIPRLDEAIQKFRTQEFKDKIVLTADENTRVLAVSRPSMPEPINPDATYVIAGGLGDLGNRICQLLASRGAKNLVVLSRRILDQRQVQRLQTNLRSHSKGLKLYCFACDISDLSACEEVVSMLDKDSLPPIKGIIQCATVLKDGVFERMTIDDFQLPLKSKLHGSHNLIETTKKFFPDFFIMLSSLSGTVGSRGQANYAAGNTFQDALAQNHAGSRTHFVSLNLGMIDGTTAYDNKEGQLRAQNLLRQGWIPVNIEQVLALIEYAISPKAREEGCKQIVIGIDGNSINHAENATPATNSLNFVHVWSAVDDPTSLKVTPISKSLKETILATRTDEQLHQIISAAVADKFSGFVAISPDEIGLDLPMADFGIDSLAAIEIKNWIGKEFEAPMQTSEILDEPSIRSLTQRIISRSKLVWQGSSSTVEPEHPEETITNASAHRTQLETQNVNGMKSEAQDIQLPRLPLPDLEQTLELYMTSARFLLSQDRVKPTLKMIQDFRLGQGQQLHKRLESRTKDPRLDSWQHELQVNRVYLKRRAPVHPYGTFYGSHLATETLHTQAERAAIISAAVSEFMQGMSLGTLEDAYTNDEPVCVYSRQWLFNAYRTPCKVMGTVARYPNNDHVAVLRRGHIFKLSLIEQGIRVPLKRLKGGFETIFRNSQHALPSMASLTADDRDKWAELYEVVTSISPRNAEVLSMIQSAAFVLCLDDGSPSTPSERCNQFLLGDPANRWSDKSLQFIVCENGASGYVCEHSMLDGGSVDQLSKFVTKAILNHKPAYSRDGITRFHGDNSQGQRTYDGTEAKIHDDVAEEYTFATNDLVEENITRVQTFFRSSYAPAELLHFHLQTYGNSMLRTHKIPSKAGAQLVVQLASRLYFGQQHPSWETLSMSHFHKGRLDWMQAISPAMSRFCEAMIDGGLPAGESLALLREAVSVHVKTMTRIRQGKGFMAHLEALREVLGEGEDVPEFFRDETWETMRVLSTRKIKTDASEGLMSSLEEAGFFMPDPESFFVHYEVEDEGVKFLVQGTEGRSKGFCEKLEEAARMVMRLLG